MTLDVLLNQLKIDHENFLDLARERIRVSACFKSYVLSFKDKSYILDFNLLTLDFKSKSKLSVDLRSKIKARIVQSDYIKWKFKKEARAFFDFLKLHETHYMGLIFTDCESPDFIIHQNGHHGYEVTEATDAHNAKFNEAVYFVTGLENHTHTLDVYLDQIKKTYKKKIKTFENDSTVRKWDDEVYKRIIACILKKVKKYKVYERELDTRNIIVFNNRIGFRRKEDFEMIQRGICQHPEIRNSNIDIIYIVSGTHDVLVSYNKKGQRLAVETLN